MLSRAKLTPATVSYYTDTVARGLDDYYSGRGESPGVWVGGGARVEGLVGEASKDEVNRLFAEGLHPASGESLGAEYAVSQGRDKVLGWDLTFSAPKSVSVLWATAGADVGFEVREAHDAAVRAGLRYVEEHAAFGRQGKAGIRQVDTDGLVGVAFVHRSSRAGDPQLHTHVLVSGRVRCDDGRWRALDSRAVHPQLKPAGMVYQAALRAELTHRLGVEWGAVTKDGQADIAGVPREALRVFSKRAAQVEARAEELIAAAEAELGRDLTDTGRRRIYKVAVLETRAPKTDAEDDSSEGLFDRWRAEAVSAGHDPLRWQGEVLGRHLGVATVDAADLVEEVLAELSHQQSTWTRGDAVKAAARRVPSTIGDADAALTWAERLTEKLLGRPGVVDLAAPEPEPPEALRRRDGRSVFEHHGSARYTTLQTLEVEQRVLDITVDGRHAGRAIADADEVESAIQLAGLGDDQADAVRAMSLDGDTVSCVVGPAGAGKSRMLGAAAAAWQASDIPVRGLAVSASAAGVLTSETGLAADTIAKFLHEQDRPGGPSDGYRMGAGEVLVVDEASMVASADLARVVIAANQNEGKVVLVGDWAQLGAIEAGGLFRLLAADHASGLSTIRRFDAEWEADASIRLRERDPTVLATYAAHGRLAGGDRTHVLDDAFRRWLAARDANHTVVLAAGNHDTVDELASRCRAARVAAGEVDPDGVLVGNQLIGARDEIVTCRNDRRLVTDHGGWVRNGDRWHVVARHDDGSLDVQDAGDRGRLRLPSDYVAEHTALAYAVTVHKAQGVTVDHAILIVDGTTTAEHLYVGMTRGRASNVALAVTHDPIDDHGAVEPPAPVDIIVAALARTSSEVAAVDVLRRSLAESESLATLKPRLANLDADLHRQCPPERTGEIDHLTARHAHLLEHGRPGVLGRAARDTRRHLTALDHKIEALRDQQALRDAWITDNTPLLDYRNRLADTVTIRTQQLGLAAALAQPDHLAALLGAIPSDDGDHRDRWIANAARIEAYREEWNVEPEHLHEPPLDGVQHRAWEATHIDVLHRLQQIDIDPPDRELSRSISIEL